MGWVLLNSCVAFAGENFLLVKTFTLINKDTVYLKDIAQIHLESKPLEQFLGDMRVAKSPSPSDEKTINARYIRSKIKRAAKKIPFEFDVTIPEVVSVKRAHKTVPESTFKKIYYHYAQKINNGKDFRAGDYSIRGNKPFPDCELRFEAEPYDIKKNMGRVSIKINVLSESGHEATVLVSAWIDVYDEAVCLRRFIQKGDAITSSDIELKTVNLSRIPDDYIRLAENAIGMSSDRQLQKGSILRKKVLTKPYMIEKGDVVLVELSSGNLKVEASGVARNSGFTGDQIEVKNSDTGKIMVGRIRDRNTIEIIF
jgi:flagella basal body P-ring formation protein FlgA